MSILKNIKGHYVSRRGIRTSQKRTSTNGFWDPTATNPSCNLNIILPVFYRAFQNTVPEVGSFLLGSYKCTNNKEFISHSSCSGLSIQAHIHWTFFSSLSFFFPFQKYCSFLFGCSTYRIGEKNIMLLVN